MTCLTDDPKSREVAALASLFMPYVAEFPFKDNKQAITVLAAVIAAMLAYRDNMHEDLTEIEEYIEDRAAMMSKLNKGI